MNILCAGINHHLATVDVREKFAVATHELAEVLARIREIDCLAGAVIVSTCNRVEFYAASVCPIRVIDGLVAYLSERTGGTEAPILSLIHI